MSNLNSSDLIQLPAKVAEVQAELQRLEQVVQQAKEKVEAVHAEERSTSASSQLLEQQLQKDVSDIHSLQLQVDDLRALKAAQNQTSQRPSAQLALQVCAALIWHDMSGLLLDRQNSQKCSCHCRTSIKQHVDNCAM